MYIPKLHAFDAEKGEAIISKAHHALVARRRTMQNPPDDGVPTEEQFDEVRFIVAAELLTEFRASIEMDAFEAIDGYLAINGEPSTTQEISAFWSEFVPAVVTPVLQEAARLQGNPATIDLAEYEPWTDSGLRPFCVALASKLRNATLEVDNQTFAHVTELDQSRMALIGTTEWVEAGEAAKTTSGAPKRATTPAAVPPRKLDDVAVDPPIPRGKPSRAQIVKDENIAHQDLVSSIWVNLGRTMNWEINKFCLRLEVSTPTWRNYTSGKRAKLNTSQAKIIRDEMKDRMQTMKDLMDQLDRFLKG